MPKLWKKIRKALADSIFWKAILLIVATGIQGSALLFSLWIAFVSNNYQAFYVIIAGTGWYAFIVEQVVKLE